DTAASRAATIYSNVRVQVGSQTYGSNAIGTTTTFTNMSVPLTAETWVPVTLLADVQTGVNNVSASSTLVASGITGVDSNYNTVTLTNAVNQTSTDNQYLTSGISIGSTVASLGTCTG